MGNKNGKSVNTNPAVPECVVDFINSDEAEGLENGSYLQSTGSKISINNFETNFITIK